MVYYHGAKRRARIISPSPMVAVVARRQLAIAKSKPAETSIVFSLDVCQDFVAGKPIGGESAAVSATWKASI